MFARLFVLIFKFGTADEATRLAVTTRFENIFTINDILLFYLRPYHTVQFFLATCNAVFQKYILQVAVTYMSDNKSATWFATAMTPLILIIKNSFCS